MSLTVRDFQPEDAAAVSQIMYESFRSYLGDRIDTPSPRPAQYWIDCSTPCRNAEVETRAFVGELDGQVVGYISVTALLLRRLGVLNRVGVDVNCFGHGIGSALFQAADKFWRERRMRKVHTCVSSINPRALAYYKKQGFHEEGILRDHFFPGVDEHQMALFYDGK